MHNELIETIFLQDIGTQNGSDITIDGEEHEIEHIQTNGALSIPLAALGFMTRLASGIFSRGQRDADDSSMTIEGDSETLLRANSLSDRNASSDSSALESPTYDRGEEHGVIQESNLSDAPDELLSESSRSEVENSSFKGFDIVKDPFDHYYLGVGGQVSCNFNDTYFNSLHCYSSFSKMLALFMSLSM